MELKCHLLLPKLVSHCRNVAIADVKTKELEESSINALQGPF